MVVAQLAYLGIGVSNMDAWKIFATNILGMQVVERADDGTALDLAMRAGIPVVSSLGRHSDDQMVSFYMSTPSGFEVEYGWGGRLVDAAVWQAQRHDRGTIWKHKVQMEPSAQPAPAAR